MQEDASVSLANYKGWLESAILGEDEEGIEFRTFGTGVYLARWSRGLPGSGCLGRGDQNNTCRKKELLLTQDSFAISSVPLQEAAHNLQPSF